GPDEVRVNRATAQALAGRADAAERELERLTAAKAKAGDVARYNLGTIQAERRADEEALASLRRAIEANPRDADARWNYEVVLHRLTQPRRPNPQQQQQPQNSGGGGGSAPQPSQPPPQPQSQGQAPP